MEGTASISSALVAGLTTAANSAVSTIMDIVPVATIVLGALFGISAGVRAFKKIAGR